MLKHNLKIYSDTKRVSGVVVITITHSRHVETVCLLTRINAEK